MAGLVTAIALLLAAVFLLRMVKPLSTAIAMVAEHRASLASAPIARLVKDRITQVLKSDDEPV